MVELILKFGSFPADIQGKKGNLYSDVNEKCFVT